jgi:predicted O-methyltransferase YrrM
MVNRFGGGMAIELEVGELIYALVRALKPEHVVETGTHKGFSTLMVAQALKDNQRGHLHTIDIVDYGVMAECGRFGLENQVTFIVGESSAVIPSLIGRIPRIDFLWLDADHGTDSVLREVEAATPLLGTGSYIALHDTISDPREAAAVREIVRIHPRWQHLSFVTARGFEVMHVRD